MRAHEPHVLLLFATVGEGHSAVTVTGTFGYTNDCCWSEMSKWLAAGAIDTATLFVSVGVSCSCSLWEVPVFV